MRTIRSWDDLAEFGIIPLTGESCGLGYRILCDLTERGRKTIAKMLGLRELPLPENWNRGSEQDPHIGSMLLTPEMLVSVAVFALLESGCEEVWLYRNGTVTGIDAADPKEQVEQYRDATGRCVSVARRYAANVRPLQVRVCS